MSELGMHQYSKFDKLWIIFMLWSITDKWLTWKVYTLKKKKAQLIIFYIPDWILIIEN